MVVHSLTKFVGGHGTTLGGMIVDGGPVPLGRARERFPMFNQPEPAFHGVVFARDFPEPPFAPGRASTLRNTGATLSPFNAFLLLQGLETLAVRLERHEANARAVADYLADDPRVAWVSFAGFPDHPYHHLAERYLDGRVPSIVTFGVRGRLRRRDRLVRRASSSSSGCSTWGTRSRSIAHPASTTHRQLTPTELEIAGVIRRRRSGCPSGSSTPTTSIDDLDQALAS